jgi:hypothetical protein
VRAATNWGGESVRGGGGDGDGEGERNGAHLFDERLGVGFKICESEVLLVEGSTSISISTEAADDSEVSQRLLAALLASTSISTSRSTLKSSLSTSTTS